MTQITEENGDCKRKSLNTDMWERERLQQNFETILHIFQKKKPAERPSLSFSDAREKISAQIVNDIYSFLNESHFIELTALDYKIEVSRIAFTILSLHSLFSNTV